MHVTCHQQVQCLTLAIIGLPSPNLPHGLNRIIIGHDAKIGRMLLYFKGLHLVTEDVPLEIMCY